MNEILDVVPYEEIDLHTSIEHEFSRINSNEITQNHKMFQTKFPVKDVTINLKMPSSHPNIKDLIDNKIISLEEVKDYNIYGVMRNPVDRFMSMAYLNIHILKLQMMNNPNQQIPFKNNLNAKNLNNLNKNDVVEFFLDKKMYQKEVLKIDLSSNFIKVHDPAVLTQTHWLKFNGQNINKIFKYEDISLLLKEITGKESSEFRHNSNTRKDRSYELPSRTIERIRELYEEDFIFWESMHQ